MLRRATVLVPRASARNARAAQSPPSLRVLQRSPYIASLSTSTAINSRLPNRDRPRFSRYPTAGGSGNGGNNNGNRPQARPEGEPTEEELEAQRRAQLEHDRALIPAELKAPVHIPDDPQGVLRLGSDPEVAKVLGQSALIVTRQIEFMNLFIGFEQANKYALMSPDGQPAGYLAEEGVSFASSLRRNFFATSRPFTATLFSTEGTPLLLFRRGFTLINSAVQVYRLDPAWNGAGYGARAGEIPGTDGVSEANQAGMQLIGESQQRWHMWRRKYELFESRSEGPSTEPTLSQFAKIDAPVLSWDFELSNKNGQLLGTINRNFRGFGREIFTDTGQYVLRFDSVANDTTDPRLGTAPGQSTGREVVPSRMATESLSLDRRAVCLGAALSIDVDFFSRHSGHGSGFGMPFFFPIPMGGGPVAGAGEAGAGEVGAAGAGAAGTAAETGAGAAAGAAAAGYGFGQQGESDPWGEPPADQGMANPWGGQSQQAPWGGGAPESGWPGSPETGVGGEDVWGEQDPWSGSDGGDGEGGGGFLSGLWDSFGDD